MSFEKFINESPLSRLWKHNIEHECGAITAFRESRECGNGEKYTKKENKQRNKSLLSKILIKGYGATELLGKYPEGGRTVKEISYFIVDLADTGNLETDLKRLGKEFEQDSILFIQKGFINKQEGSVAYLIGTNHCKNSWIKYNNKSLYKVSRLGKSSPIFTSYINGKPFLFEDVDFTRLKPQSGFGMMALEAISKKHWTEIEV